MKANGLNWNFPICCIGILILIYPFQSHSQNGSNHQNWAKDIDFVDRIIRTQHPNPFHNISEEQWSNTLQHLKKNVNNLAENEIPIRISEIVALLNDGHTFLDFDGKYGFDRWFPVRFYDFDDGLFITVAHPKYKHLIGKKVSSISGLPASDILNTVAKAISGDNGFHKKNIAAAFLSSKAVLEGLGILENKQNLTIQYIDENDTTSTVELAPVSSFYSTNYRNWGELFGPPSEDYDTFITPFENGKPPLRYREFSDAAPPYYASREPYWFKNYPEYASLWFQFNFAAEIGPESFTDFRSRLVDTLEATKPEKFIIDVRYNFGGDGSMMVPLVNDIITYSGKHPKTKLYIVLGRQTFSAGIMLVARLKEYLNITTVGEPAGAGYNHFGDPVPYKLPNSELQLYCSSVLWQLGHPLEDYHSISVEFPVRVKASDFFQGNDPAFLKIVGSDDLRHLSDIYLEENIATAVSIYRSRYSTFGKLKWWNPFYEDSDQINKKLALIVEKQKTESAIKLGVLWTEYHPENPLAWLQLAELYCLQKKYDLAMDALKKAEKLDADRLDIKESLLKIRNLQKTVPKR